MTKLAPLLLSLPEPCHGIRFRVLWVRPRGRAESSVGSLLGCHGYWLFFRPVVVGLGPDAEIHWSSVIITPQSMYSAEQITGAALDRVLAREARLLSAARSIVLGDP